jgi:hypothetical protein
MKNHRSNGTPRQPCVELNSRDLLRVLEATTAGSPQRLENVCDRLHISGVDQHRIVDELLERTLTRQQQITLQNLQMLIAKKDHHREEVVKGVNSSEERNASQDFADAPTR